MRKLKHGKRLFSWALALSMAAGSFMGSYPVQALDLNVVAPGKPTDLKTELLSEAYGINTKNPAFSWVVNDPESNEVQTAYRMTFSKTSEFTSGSLLYDTGWVESDENSYVHVPGLENKLEDNQVYFWRVETKDKNGVEGQTSDPAVFMTDIASEWESVDGIWAVPQKGDNSWKDYTLEAKMSILSGDGVGILMRIDGNNNGYMLQFRQKDNTVACHWAEGGAAGITGNTLFQTLNLSESGITIPTNGSEFKIKLAMAGSNIQVSIDTGSGYKSAGTVDLSKVSKINVTAGAAGFRTGRSESGTIDDLKITDASGNALYESDFSDGNVLFPGCSISNGKLSVGNSAFSVWSDPDKLQERGNISFIRSPKITIDDKAKIEKVIVSAASRGTALDRGTIFDLFFNGTCVGAGSARELGNVGSFAGTTNYTQVYYNSYDVTDAVVQGNENVISAIANSRDSNHGVLVQMTAFYKDGTKKILTNSGKTGSGWKTLDGTNAFGDTGNYITTGYVSVFHDNVNMNVYPEGWQKVSFDDSGWQEAKINKPVADNRSGTSGRVLYPNQSENALRMETDEPTKRIYQNAAGNIVIDLGKEIIGGLKVNIASNSAQSVTVYMGEEMDGDSVKHQLTAAPNYVDTWKLKKGNNAFETMTFRTFRYVELIGLDNTTKTGILNDKNSVKGWAIQQAFDDEDSSFEASGGDREVLLNRLYELSKYTIQATNQDVFVDSQARERLPYEGDLLVNSNTSYAVSGKYSLARHSNEWLIDNPTWPNDYSLFSVEMSYWDYIYTGNTDSIRENYDALKKKLTIKRASEDSQTGLIRVNGSQAGETALIDWPTSERDGYQGSRYDVVINTEYVGIYRYMAAISEALGQTADAATYREKADKLQNSLITYAYDKENGRFYDSLDQSYMATNHSSTHATAYALTYGVFDSQEMADDMCAFVYGNCKDEFKGSVYVTYFILKGLYNGNHGEMAQKLMTNPKIGTNVKTFASLLDNLYCTITPEAWGHAHKNNMTLSHPWGAAPGCSIVQGLFGIMPVKAGFKEFAVKLQPGGIASASVKAPTVKGAVYVSYEHGSEAELAENKLTASVTVPANTKAIVSLPVSGAEDVWLIVDGVKTEADYDGKYLSAAVGSGTHTFSLGSLTEMSLELSNGNTMTINDTDQAILNKVYSDGTKEALTSGITYTVEGDAIEINESGTVTANKEGKAVLTAAPSALDKESLALPTEIISSEVWTFDGINNPFSNGASLVNGKVSVPVSASANNTEYQGTVVSGIFEIGEVAATIAFNVRDEQNRYFWQFSKTEGLKRHTQINNDIAQYGSTVPIGLKDGENTFIIATKENKIYTWLNGKCVDICDAHASLPTSGGFGVRTGRSESFTLSRISVSDDWKAIWAKTEITVKKQETPGNKPDVKKPVVKLNVKTLPIQVKKSAKVLKASGMIAGDKVKQWKSSKPSVVSVNAKNGKITAKKTGTAKITVITKKGAKASCTVKVQKKQVKTKSLSVTNVKKNKVTIRRKKSFKLSIQRKPLTATDKITYKSSKPSVAKVSASGKITAKKKGKAVITIKSASGKKKKVTVTVK